MKKRHVALYLPNLNGGGAQRVMVTLANEFASRGIRTDLVLVRKEGPFYRDVSDKVNVFDLNSSRASTSLFGLIRYLRQECPSSVLATLAGTNVIAALAHWLSGSEASLVLRETNSVSAANNRFRSVKGISIHLASFIAYPYSTFVVGISKGLSNEIKKVFHLNSKRVVTIYNPLKKTAFDQKDNGIAIDTRVPIVLGVGRLVKQKDFSTLIQAFARVRLSKQACLYILGEGDKRSELEELACDLGVRDNVYMPGFVDNPFEYMRAADVFVLSSRWEGFGNVLVEAMACGTPVVSTDCPSGPAEILENGKWGKLVPVGSDSRLAEAIIDTISSPRDVIDTTERAADFKTSVIADQYLKILDQGPT